MKAIIWKRFGPPSVLQYKEVAHPVPGKRDVLIKIHATTVTAGDCEIRSLQVPFLFRLPLRIFMLLRKLRKEVILGQEFSGIVESTGSEVTQFQKGDHVFATSGMVMGTYAHYICLPENAVMIKKPETISFEDAAALPVGGLNALYFLKKAGIAPGKRVLVYGASGSIGTYAVQLARYFKAEVTAVCSGKHFGLVKSLGADVLIDYTQEDFSQRGERYDLIFDTVGKSPYARSIRSLRANGCYLLANPGLSQTLRGLVTGLCSSKRVMGRAASLDREGLGFLGELVTRKAMTVVIDRTYALEQVVEAHTYVEQGHKQGNVVIRVRHDAAQSEQENYK